MQIHIVQTGQSLFSIAQTYNSTIGAIVGANELPNPNNLILTIQIQVENVIQYGLRMLGPFKQNLI